MPGSLLGNAVRRVEDPELLVGDARYVDDLPIDALLHLSFVRSPYPHAKIVSIDVDAARSMPGVVAVYTFADLGVASSASGMGMNPKVQRAPLVEDEARFAGDTVAVVVAERLAQAVDATEAVEVDYDVLPAVADLDAAMAIDAPLVFAELGSNLYTGSREPSDEDPMAGADVVVRGRFENQRVAVAPMEGNAIAVVPGGIGDEFDLTVHVATQMPHRLKDAAVALFGLDPARIRVVSPFVGGGFGGKTGLCAEFATAIAVVRLLGRPVKWIETRSENLVGMDGRSQVQYVEMGFRSSGEIVGLRGRVIGDSGAYGGFGGFLAMGPTRNMAQGPYKIPKIRFDVAVALTNTSMTGAFRGAGRPEATAMLERLMDMGADDLGIDPAELRRMNFLTPDQFPYTTVTGMLYDCGEYERALDAALAAADYATLRKEQAVRRERGDRLQLGIGVSSYVEITAGGTGGEFGAVEVHPDGTATIRVGTAGSGQGHATSFSMIVADRLGLPLESIKFVQSDTAQVPRGGGTVGSRSLQLGGSAISDAAKLVLDMGRELAAELLEADPADVVVNDEGSLGVVGVPARAIPWSKLAALSAERGETLAAGVDFTPPGATFPFGSHVSLVEVDLDTGKVTPIRHIAVDDAGRILNPLLVTGQQHGGIAQGMAQALWEHLAYDEEANPVTGTFATYGIPSAAEVPSYEASNTETPTAYNPLGAKGIGESGTIGATPSVQNAVVDALSYLGVRHVDMPCTPERVWRAIVAAKSGAPEEPWREPPAIFKTLPDRVERARPGDEETH
ncbi:MAG TPA: xanthine dehydrogenase family protein molybdopterin-binding subunit [Acidimicrobiales bacterium]